MLFNSLNFLIFLPVTFLVYYSLPQRSRWIFMLVASYFFYAGWKVQYLGLIAFSTVVDYFMSNLIYKTEDPFKRKVMLGVSLTINFSFLILFKYFHFLIGGNSWFKELAATHENIMWLQFIFEYGIPVGISFYTFQAVSYTVDVYRKRVVPERNLGKFALYMSFFPQLVAGPIERFSHLHPQLFKKFVPTLETFRQAFQIALLGFFLKMTIADNLGSLIAPVFSNPESYAAAWKILAVALFGIQIYTDFNGYTLIAIGVARLFGVHLMDNFRLPYGAYSIKDFWARWHISLSTWFRDYVYVPLGGSKSTRSRWIMGILLTFGLSGLWHGANVTFIYWGLIHGVYYLIEQAFFPVARDKNPGWLEKSVRWLLTMTVVGIGWLFFRADSMKIVGKFFQAVGEQTEQLHFSLQQVVPICVFLVIEVIIRQSRPDVYLENKKTAYRWLCYLILLFCILFFSDTGNMQFIYFQF